MQTSSSPLAQQVRSIMESGGYVTDDITNAIVADRLSQTDCQDGFILDGFPRTLPQVRALEMLLARSGQRIDAVVSLVVDRDEVVARLLKRATIENRPDDTEKTIRVRQQGTATPVAWRVLFSFRLLPSHHARRPLLTNGPLIGFCDKHI